LHGNNYTRRSPQNSQEKPRLRDYFPERTESTGKGEEIQIEDRDTGIQKKVRERKTQNATIASEGKA